MKPIRSFVLLMVPLFVLNACGQGARIAALENTSRSLDQQNKRLDLKAVEIEQRLEQIVTELEHRLKSNSQAMSELTRQIEQLKRDKSKLEEFYKHVVPNIQENGVATLDLEGSGSAINPPLQNGSQHEEGYLGVSITTVSPEAIESLSYKSTKGALIVEVAAGSAAEIAGLKVNDIVYRMDGQEVANSEDLVRIVKSVGAGRSAHLYYTRNGQKLRAVVHLQSRNAPTQFQTMNFPIIGLTLRQLTENERISSARLINGAIAIEKVEQNSDAEQKLLTPGDIILEINQKKVSTIFEANQMLTNARNEGRNSVLLQLLSSRGDSLETRFVALKLKN